MELELTSLQASKRDVEVLFGGYGACGWQLVVLKWQKGGWRQPILVAVGSSKVAVAGEEVVEGEGEREKKKRNPTLLCLALR